MPLHPEAQAVLDQMVESGAPALDELPPAEARAFFDVAFAVPAGQEEPIARLEDRSVPGPAGEIPVRLYAPGGGRLPTLVHFHGGGWVIGSLATHDAFCRSLANQSGCAVVAVDYRLAPEHRFPAAFDDCLAALDWVASHGAELGIDTGRLGVIGDSAGGNLAAAVSLAARDAGGPPLQVQILTYPAVEPAMTFPSIRENAEGYFLTEASMRWFYGHYLPDGTDLRDSRLAPLHAESHTGLPPALVVTAEFDPLRDEGEAYSRALEAAGVPVELRCYDGMFHGFALMSAAIGAGRECIAAEAAFAKTHLG